LQKIIVGLGVVIFIIGIPLMLYSNSITVPGNPNSSVCPYQPTQTCTVSDQPYLGLGVAVSLVGFMSSAIGGLMINEEDLPSSHYEEISSLKKKVETLEKTIANGQLANHIKPELLASPPKSVEQQDVLGEAIRFVPFSGSVSPGNAISVTVKLDKIIVEPETAVTGLPNEAKFSWSENPLIAFEQLRQNTLRISTKAETNSGIYYITVRVKGKDGGLAAGTFTLTVR